MTDPWLSDVERRLRAPVPVSADFDARVLDRVRAAGRPPRLPRAVVPLAAAAAIGALAFGLLTRGPAPGVVEFALDAPAATEVVLVGDFNDWDRARTPLRRDPRGRWRAEMTLAGGLYHYAFLVDGARWVADPARPGHTDPDFGEAVSLVAVE